MDLVRTSKDMTFWDVELLVAEAVDYFPGVSKLITAAPTTCPQWYANDKLIAPQTMSRPFTTAIPLFLCELQNWNLNAKTQASRHGVVAHSEHQLPKLATGGNSRKWLRRNLTFGRIHMGHLSVGCFGCNHRCFFRSHLLLQKKCPQWMKCSWKLIIPTCLQQIWLATGKISATLPKFSPSSGLKCPGLLTVSVFSF